MGNLAVITNDAPMTLEAVQGQVAQIQELMKTVMIDNQHYGKIPGCGDKPTLLKAGAEKIMLTFRLVPETKIDVLDLPGGHREYRAETRIFTQTGVFLGNGVGTASTMESKYRFRTGEIKFTDQPVPQAYWTLKKNDPAKAQALIGGPGHAPRKNDTGQWVIALQGEKTEHDNPADYYNTCEKMAKKRAFVDAALTVTAASDIFAQDLEELEVKEEKPKEQAKKAPAKSDQKASRHGCRDCGVAIEQKVASYSKDRFGRELCLRCQKIEQEGPGDEELDPDELAKIID